MKPPVDPGIYLLADHLDAALAAGEDLLAAELAAPADIDRAEPGSSAHAIAVFVNDLKRLEAALAARILQARRRAAELPRQDPLVRGVIDLFQSSTSSALALVEHFSRLHEGTTFDPSYLTPFAVLRSRGLLAPDAAELPPFERVTVTEAYLIGGVLRLGEILNVVAATLDTLDNHFDLYLDNAARAAGAYLETADTTLHDPAELLRTAVEAAAAAAPPDAAAATLPETASVSGAEVSTEVRPESDSVSTATSVSSGTLVSPIEVAPVTSSAEPVAASSKSVQAPASMKLAAATSALSEASGSLNMPAVTKALGASATGASSSPKAATELANAAATAVRTAGNAKELAAATGSAPNLEMPSSGSAQVSTAALPATPREDAIQDMTVNASAAADKAHAAGELKISVPAPSEKSAVAVTSPSEQKKAESSPDAAPASLAPLKEDKALGRGAPAEAKSSGVKADKSAEKPARAAESAQPKPAKKPMTLLEALAALDKTRPPTFPSG